jgi:hypothetical protein
MRGLARRFSLLVVPTLCAVIIGCGGSGMPGGSPTPPINPNDAKLSGMYAFATESGLIGTLQADGKGNITGGIEDKGAVSVAVTGTYTIGPDGRGIITVKTPTESQVFQLVMLSSQHGFLLQLQPDVNFAPPLAGVIDLQDTSAFSLATLSSSYAFAFDGQGTDAVGMFAINSSGVITSGTEDVAIQGVLPNPTLSLSGTLSAIDAHGRGTAVFTTTQGTVHFVFYVVDRTNLIFLSTDATFFEGHAFSQQGPFTNASVPAHLVLLGAFNGSLSSIFFGALLTTDGAGHVTAGTADIVNPGGGSAGPPPSITTVDVTGSYSMGANGRGTLSFADSAGTFSSSFVMYSCSAGLLLLDTQGPARDLSGRLTNSVNIALTQQAGPFSNALLTGSYGELEKGTSFSVEPFAFGSLNGLVADGAGHLTGTGDFQLQGGKASLDGTFTGTYATAANGRGTGTLNKENMVFYLSSGSRVLFVTNGVSHGIWQQQQ